MFYLILDFSEWSYHLCDVKCYTFATILNIPLSRKSDFCDVSTNKGNFYSCQIKTNSTNQSCTTRDEITARKREDLKSWFEPGTKVHMSAGIGRSHGLRSSSCIPSCKVKVQVKREWSKKMSASFNIINEHSLFLKREEKLAWFKIMAIGKTENSQIYMKIFPKGLGQGTHFHLSYTLETFFLHWCLKINVLVEYIWKSNNNKQIKISLRIIPHKISKCFCYKLRTKSNSLAIGKV